MRSIFRNLVCCTAIVSAVGFFGITFAETTHFNKAQVGDRIRKVENGVDDFDKYLSTRGENASNKAGSAKNSGATNRRQGGDAANKDARKDQATQSKDDLQDAMDDRIARPTVCDASSTRRRITWKPKYKMEQVMDSARRVNQVVAKNKNDSQAGRLWTALRASINDLARCYNITPMGG